MKRFIAGCICLILFSSLQAQVVNIEKKRIGKDDEGFSGKIDLSFGLTETETEIIQGNNTLRLQYKKGPNTFLFFNNLSLIKSGNDKLLNDGFQHIRYNYRIEKIPLTWEVFTQHQYNTVQLLKRRILAGTGPRIRIVDTDTTSFFFGPLVMYENEILTDDSTRFETIRLSTYLAFSIHLTKMVGIHHITYYQPDLMNFDDYRISSETSLRLDFTKRLAFKVIFNYAYDSKPPLGINKNFYSISNAISFSF